MLVYNITESPVLVRKIASADSGIVNVLPVGSKLYVLGEESGWYRTASGYYVFKTDNIILDSPLQSPKLMMARSATTLRATSPTQTRYEEYMDDGSGGISDEELNKAWEEEQREKTKLAEEDKKEAEESERRKRDLNLSSQVSGATVTATKVAAIDPSTGEPYISDETGEYVWQDAPTSLTENNNKSNVQYVSADGEILVVEDASGKKYYVQAETAIINEKDSMDDVREAQRKKEEEEYKKKIDESIKKSKSITDIIKSLSGSLMTEIAALNKVTIDDARTVFGMPYQFLPIVDPRLAEDDPNNWDKLNLFGRKYKEKIVARAPILVMQPGLPVFLKGFSDDIKQEVMSNVFNVGKSELDEIVLSQGQLYAFELRARDYFYAVNTACRAVAVYLGIANVEVPNLTRDYTGSLDSASGNQGMLMSGVNPRALGSMNWSLHPEHPFGGYYAGASYFYINSDAQVSENFSTATRQSELAGKLNQISDAAMEALFLGGIGGKGLGSMGKMAKETAGAAAKQSGTAKGVGEKINEYGNDLGGAMGSIVKNIGALISGGKMMFPEIWQDSSVGRSYNVTIKLDSPDSDKVSIYLNILVPLIHILGFVLPRFAASNTYITPFLVRCFYKSMFHIDMGMITSCDIVKGDMGAWTQDGLPTQIIVNLSIKDLYSVLSQSTNYGNNTMLSNPAQMEYLASMCGISVAPANLSRSLELWYTLKGVNRLRDQIMDAYNAMMQVTFSTINNIAQPTRWQN